MDADGDPGTIINQAPCHCTFTATFRGKSAHAGVEPERGVSALAMAAQAVCHMPLGRISAHTTSNVGVIECDGATNVVPGTCWLSGECRSTSLERARAERSAMDEAMRAAAAQAGGSVDIEWRTDYLPISYASDHPLVEGVMRAARAAGLRPRLAASGGGADANILAGRGVSAITLATGMANYHSCDEYITVDNLNGCARLVERLVLEARK